MVVDRAVGLRKARAPSRPAANGAWRPPRRGLAGHQRVHALRTRPVERHPGEPAGVPSPWASCWVRIAHLRLGRGNGRLDGSPSPPSTPLKRQTRNHATPASATCRDAGYLRLARPGEVVGRRTDIGPRSATEISGYPKGAGGRLEAVVLPAILRSVTTHRSCRARVNARKAGSPRPACWIDSPQSRPLHRGQAVSMWEMGTDFPAAPYYVRAASMAWRARLTSSSRLLVLATLVARLSSSPPMACSRVVVSVARRLASAP